MSKRGSISWKPRCAHCGTSISHPNALITSCGHFYCACCSSLVLHAENDASLCLVCGSKIEKDSDLFYFSEEVFRNPEATLPSSLLRLLIAEESPLDRIREEIRYLQVEKETDHFALLASRMQLSMREEEKKQLQSELDRCKKSLIEKENENVILRERLQETLLKQRQSLTTSSSFLQGGEQKNQTKCDLGRHQRKESTGTHNVCDLIDFARTPLLDRTPSRMSHSSFTSINSHSHVTGHIIPRGGAGLSHRSPPPRGRKPCDYSRDGPNSARRKLQSLLFSGNSSRHERQVQQGYEDRMKEVSTPNSIQKKRSFQQSSGSTQDIFASVREMRSPR